MAQDAEFAIAMPGSNLWGQTFMKRFEGAVNAVSGEYTYTSERERM